jgi:hypothetical protein
LQDFLFFNETIQENKAEIGAAQFFGKSRVDTFEEHLYSLLQAKIRIPEPLQLLWGKIPCLAKRRKRILNGI